MHIVIRRTLYVAEVVCIYVCKHVCICKECYHPPPWYTPRVVAKLPHGYIGLHHGFFKTLNRNRRGLNKPQQPQAQNPKALIDVFGLGCRVLGFRTPKPGRASWAGTRDPLQKGLLNPKPKKPLDSSKGSLRGFLLQSGGYFNDLTQNSALHKTTLKTGFLPGFGIPFIWRVRGPSE